MSSAESRYATYNRELLLSFEAVKHFHHLLLGQQFCLRTDHKPLVSALARPTEPWNQCQARQLMFLAEYDFVAEHISGSDKTVPDALSRAPVPEPVSPVWQVAVSPSVSAPSAAEMRRKQKKCSETSALASSPSLQIRYDDTGLLVDVSRSSPRLVVPASLCRRVFSSIHLLAHAGV